MRAVSERISQSTFDGSTLRVVLLLDLHDGAQERFVEAYEDMARRVSSAPGHVSDQLCQSIENPGQWLITSEWESARPFLDWVNSEEHVRTVQPLHRCVREARSLRYSVLRETGIAHAAVAADGTAARRLQKSPRFGDGVVRHALTFTVRPGSEDVVAKILGEYAPPPARVDDRTRLRRTSVFLHGNRVVRTIEVEGDLMAALRHVARQPEVRAAEEALNPYLEQDRDLGDPDSARTFFTRAALPMAHHEGRTGTVPPEVRRHALLYRAKRGCGAAVAQLLGAQDAAAADDPSSPVHSSTVFQRGDVVVRLVDMAGPPDARPALALGIDGDRKAAVLTRLLDGDANGLPTSDGELPRFLARSGMRLITDRCADPS